MKDNSNKVLVVGVIALVLGIVIGGGTWPKLNFNLQKGASLETQTSTTRDGGSGTSGSVNKENITKGGASGGTTGEEILVMALG